MDHRVMTDGDALKQRIGDNLICRDAVLQRLILKSSRSLLDQSNDIQSSWRFKQRLLQERLRMKMLLAHRNPFQIDSSEGILDPNQSLLLERGLNLKTHALTTAALYQEAFQQIQEHRESLLLTRLAGMTNLTRRNHAAPLLHDVPFEIHIQQDATSYKDEDKDADVRASSDSHTNVQSQRNSTNSFPSQLHEMLSNPEYSEYITWLPHGRAWRILQRTQFERMVIPRHFRHGHYSSFMRQVRICSD